MHSKDHIYQLVTHRNTTKTMYGETLVLLHSALYSRLLVVFLSV